MTLMVTPIWPFRPEGPSWSNCSCRILIRLVVWSLVRFSWSRALQIIRTKNSETDRVKKAQPRTGPFQTNGPSSHFHRGTIPRHNNNDKIFMIFQNLREIFSLEFFFISRFVQKFQNFQIFAKISSFSKFSFFYFLSFLFNFVSMDYSRYVIKASDGSFINSSCEYCESRDDSSGHPWVYCVFHLIRFCEIIWILHGKLSFMTS